MRKLDIDTLIEESQRIASTIFPKILEENKRLGIATPIGIAGRIYFIMPDGKILTEEEYKALTPAPSPRGRGEVKAGPSPNRKGGNEKGGLFPKGEG